MDEAVENKLGRVAFTLNALGPNPLKRGGAKQMPLLAIAQQAVLPAAVGAYLIHRFVIKRKKGQTGGAPAKSAAAAPEANGKPHPQSAQGKVKEKPRRHYKVKRELDDDAGRQEARAQMLQLMAQAGLVANGVADEDDEGEDEDEEGAEGQGQGQNSADFIRMLQGLGYKMVMSQDGSGKVYMVPPDAQTAEATAGAREGSQGAPTTAALPSISDTDPPPTAPTTSAQRPATRQAHDGPSGAQPAQQQPSEAHQQPSYPTSIQHTAPASASQQQQEGTQHHADMPDHAHNDSYSDHDDEFESDFEYDAGGGPDEGSYYFDPVPGPYQTRGSGPHTAAISHSHTQGVTHHTTDNTNSNGDVGARSQGRYLDRQPPGPDWPGDFDDTGFDFDPLDPLNGGGLGTGPGPIGPGAQPFPYPPQPLQPRFDDFDYEYGPEDDYDDYDIHDDDYFLDDAAMAGVGGMAGGVAGGMAGGYGDGSDELWDRMMDEMMDQAMQDMMQRAGGGGGQGPAGVAGGGRGVSYEEFMQQLGIEEGDEGGYDEDEDADEAED